MSGGRLTLGSVEISLEEMLIHIKKKRKTHEMKQRSRSRSATAPAGETEKLVNTPTSVQTVTKALLIAKYVHRVLFSYF